MTRHPRQSTELPTELPTELRRARLWPRLRRAAPPAALMAIPVTAVAQAVMASGDRNPAGTHVMVIGGWIMVAGLAAFCVLAFAMALFPGLHRE